MKHILQIAFIFCFCIITNAQEIINCGTDQYHEIMLNNYDYRLQFIKSEENIYNIQKSSSAKDNKDIVYSIPVVFHLICRPGSQPGDFYDGNPDDNTVITSFLANLNDAYRNTGSFDQGVGSDMEIEFCLACRDTNGNSTTGITRFETHLADSCGLSVNSYYTDSIKHLTFWDPKKYLNVWIIANLIDASGFSTFPWMPRDYRDGVIIDIAYLTTGYVAGVMLAHEIGHYTGLYHIFQNGCANNDCLLHGDRVCDTPPSTQENIVLTCSDNTCSTDADDTTANNPFTTDVEDNLRTYMNYGLPTCINQFTEGQKARARLYLTNYRYDLLTSDGCDVVNKITFVENNENINIFYNSTNRLINLAFNDNGIFEVYLIDQTGKTVFYKTYNGTNNAVISTNDLCDGIYLVKIFDRDAESIKVEKVVVY
ncbi:MAG: zinc-dependent metalloprotease [Bacteroidota bacterium]